MPRPIRIFLRLFIAEPVFPLESQGGAHERLQVGHGVVVGEDGRDPIGLRLCQDGLGVDQLHEGDRAELVALSREAELLIGELTVPFLEQCAPVERARVRQPDRQVRFEGELPALGPAR